MNRWLANLGQIIQNYKTNCNTLSVTKECSRIPGEELWTNSSWFLWIRVEVLYEALLVKHKWGTQTNTTKHISMNEQYEWCKAQYKWERVKRKWIKHKYKDMFRGSSTQLYVPRFRTEGFSLTRPHRTSHTGNLYWGFWETQIGSTQLLSQPIQPLTRGKAQNKSPLHLEG